MQRSARASPHDVGDLLGLPPMGWIHGRWLTSKTAGSAAHAFPVVQAAPGVVEHRNAGAAVGNGRADPGSAWAGYRRYRTTQAIGAAKARVRPDRLEDLDAAGVAVDANPVAGPDAPGANAGVDDTRDAELTRDDGGVTERAADVDDERGGDEHDRGPARVGRRRDEDLVGLDVGEARVRDDARDALDDAGARRRCPGSARRRSPLQVRLVARSPSGPGALPRARDRQRSDTPRGARGASSTSSRTSEGSGARSSSTVR